MVRFAGGAETDLVRGDHTVTGVAQGLDRGVPRGAAEILAVHEHDALAIGLAVGGDIHVAHLQGFALGLEGEMLDRIGVLETLQLGAVGRTFGGDGGQGGGQQQAGQPAGEGEGHGETPEEIGRCWLGLIRATLNTGNGGERWFNRSSPSLPGPARRSACLWPGSRSPESGRSVHASPRRQASADHR
ncbi:hypothetical protein D3C73_769920 [compost metagenome]